MKEQQQNNEVIQSPIESQPTGDGVDLSPVTDQLGELINIISSELELKKRKSKKIRRRKKKIKRS